MTPGSMPLRMRPQSRPVCQLCDFLALRPQHRRAFLSTSALRSPSTASTTSTAPTRRQHTPPAVTLALARLSARRHVASAATAAAADSAQDTSTNISDRIAALKEQLAAVERQIQAIYASNKVEAESVILEALDGLDSIAQQAIAIRSRQPTPAKTSIHQSSAGAILSGLTSDDDSSAIVQKTRQRPLSLNELPTPAYLSKLAEDLLRHPTVFISPDVLAVYIHLQRLLARPRSIPEILYLYANKPVPVQGSSPPKFSKPSPSAAKQAIPADLAHDALTAAIDAKDLSLALNVVDHTYRAPAWRRHRIITKLGTPGALVAIAPLALYMIAQELSVYSGFIDPFTYKIYAFAGMSTYALCTGTLGFVALTTYNDDHDRVVWRPGVPLLDRYLRADERAALDRIACAWGFKEEWKRGDEEGDDWEGLRQWILLRGMVLDKPDLLPGQNPSR
jgi:hypothetical protein